MERDSPGEWVPYTQETRNFIVSLAAAAAEAGGGEDFPTPSLRHFAGGIKVVNEEEEAAGVEKRKRAFLKALHRSGRETARIFLPASTAKVYHLFIG